MKPGYESDMQRQVARGITARPVGRGVLLEIPCTGGHTVEHALDKMLPPDAMPRQLAQRGWRIARRKATCPDCVTKEKNVSSHLVTRAELSAEPFSRQPAAPPPPAVAAVAPEREATPDAKRVHRTVMEALMSVYDDDAKRYTGGYTDARVAEETGAALAYVAKVREDYFGPIAEPAEIVALRKDHAAVIEAIAAVRRDMATVRQGFEATLADLDKKAQGIGHRLDNAAQANGWKR